MIHPPVVLIGWIDAWANAAGYYDSSYVYESLEMQEVGYLVQENKHGILTARSWQKGEPDDRFRGESFTPWEMITKYEVLDYD